MATQTKVKIRRSTVTTSPGTILEVGELAYSYNSNTLYIGGAAGVGATAIPIGGTGAFASINSPVFTGDPQAPTPAVTDDDTSIATTEWVRDLALSDFTGTNNGDINFNNFKIINLADPTNPGDAANKQYVDNAVQGLDAKESVVLKTTGNISISSPGSATADFDGLDPTTVTGGVYPFRILVTNQTNTAENGIYEYNGSAVALTRTSDAVIGTLSANAYTFVEQGTNFADAGFVLFNAVDPINVGTDSLEFTQFNGTGSINAGAGLEAVGNTINVGTADVNRIVVNANNIDLATTGVSANNYIGFTVDAYGRITAVTTPTTLAGYGITDAQPLNADLTAIAALTGTGYLTRTGANTYATRNITGTANSITVVDGGGTAGDTNISIATTYPGQTSIATVGTISTGTWQADLVGLQYGGTGADLTAGANANCLVAVNGTATALEAVNTIDGGTF